LAPISFQVHLVEDILKPLDEVCLRLVVDEGKVNEWRNPESDESDEDVQESLTIGFYAARLGRKSRAAM
jgi:hypothetical protein